MHGFRSLTRWAAVAACACFSICMPPVALGEAFTVDAVHSSVLFRVKHLNTSDSWGRFNDISGKVDVNGSDLALDVQVKIDSVDTGNAKRDEHLKGPDFFSAKQFPTIAFKSTKSTGTGEATAEVEGTITLHGVTRPVTIKLQRSGINKGLMGGKIVGLSTTFTVKRSDYGMKFLLGGIGDEVLVIVSLECAAQ